MAFDADWRITYINGAAERIYRTSREQLVGRDFWQAFPASVTASRRSIGAPCASRWRCASSTTTRRADAGSTCRPFRTTARSPSMAATSPKEARGRGAACQRAALSAASPIRCRSSSSPPTPTAASPTSTASAASSPAGATRCSAIGRYALLHPEDRERVRETWIVRRTRGPALRSREPPAPGRRRLSLGAEPRPAGARRRRARHRMDRRQHRHPRAAPGAAGARRGRPPQGRIPRHAGARAAQSAGAASATRCTSCAMRGSDARRWRRACTR